MKKTVVLIFALIFLNSCWYDEILNNKVLTTGKIISHVFPGKGSGYRLKYEYKEKDTIYTWMYPIAINYYDYDTTFAGKFFPVVYSKINPYKSTILIRPSDFEDFGYEFPDSLNWVKECFNEN